MIFFYLSVWSACCKTNVFERAVCTPLCKVVRVNNISASACITLVTECSLNVYVDSCVISTFYHKTCSARANGTARSDRCCHDAEWNAVRVLQSNGVFTDRVILAHP